MHGEISILPPSGLLSMGTFSRKLRMKPSRDLPMNSSNVSGLSLRSRGVEKVPQPFRSILQ